MSLSSQCKPGETKGARGSNSQADGQTLPVLWSIFFALLLLDTGQEGRFHALSSSTCLLLSRQHFLVCSCAQPTAATGKHKPAFCSRSVR